MARQSVIGPVPLTSLTKKERAEMQNLGKFVLSHLGQGEGDEDWFEITYQARRPATDEEIELSAWEPVTHGRD